MPQVGEWKAYRPDGFTDPPTTVREALQQARAVLDEEGRWMRRQWFHNEHPEIDPEDPFCNNWAVCAEGAIAIVTVGTQCLTYNPHNVVEPVCWFTSHVADSLLDTGDPVQRRLYRDALVALRSAGAALTGISYTDAFAYNDHHFDTRTAVLAWFDKAIEMADAVGAGA